MEVMETLPLTDAPAPVSSSPRPVERTAPKRRATPVTRPVLAPVTASGAGFDTALATHRQASQTLADAALEHLSARIHAAAGTVEFTVELNPAGTSRLICEALEENMVRLLQMTVLDQIAYAVLATTTHSPTRTHAAAMTWQAGRILPARR